MELGESTSFCVETEVRGRMKRITAERVENGNTRVNLLDSKFASYKLSVAHMSSTLYITVIKLPKEFILAWVSFIFREV